MQEASCMVVLRLHTDGQHLRTVMTSGTHMQEDAMHEIFASNLQNGLAPGRTAARKILARLARQVRQPYICSTVIAS